MNDKQNNQHDQGAMNEAFAEWQKGLQQQGEWKGDAPTIKDRKQREVDEKEAELFGEAKENEGEAAFNNLLETANRGSRISAIRLRAHLMSEWFAMFYASKWVTEMHFGGVICIMKDEAEDEKLREAAEVYYGYIENAIKMVKRPDSNDQFWMYVRRIRERWDKEVKVNWRQVIMKEIPKMEAP